MNMTGKSAARKTAEEWADEINRTLHGTHCNRWAVINEDLAKYLRTYASESVEMWREQAIKAVQRMLVELEREWEETEFQHVLDEARVDVEALLRKLPIELP